MINIFMLSAANPLNTSGMQHNIKNYNSSPEQVVGRRIDLQHSNASRVRTNGAGCIYSDNFNGLNDTTSLQARGYKTYYRGGGPQGTTAIWFQGNPSTFNSYNGPDSGYVASNYNSVTDTNNIDNWLVLPSLNLKANDIVSFYSRSPSASPYPDSLHVWYSAAGDSLPEDTSWVLIGEFVVNTGNVWEYKAFSVPADAANGRIAIRYAVVNGGPQGANSNFIGIDELLVFTPSVEDGNLFSISSPFNGCLLSSSETITVVIKNSGTNPISGFNVSYTLDSGTPIVETITNTIAPGNSLTYSFTTLANLSVAGAHSITANVIVSNDTNLCNDEKSIVVKSFSPIDPLVTPYSMGFESNEDFSSWKFEDVNGDTIYWQTVGTFSHSGVTCIRKALSSSNDDDWLYTGCFDLTGGTSYTLDYWYMIFDPASGCNLESYVGNAQSMSQMTQLLVKDTLPTDTVYHHSIITFSVPNSGIYFIGFHAYSSGGTGTSSLRLDDINLDNGTFIGIKENSISNRVSIYPNPGAGIFYLNAASYSKNVNVDIFNVSGQKIYSSQYNNLNQQRIDLSKQSNGIYTIRITSDSFVENHSIILNR